MAFNKSYKRLQGVYKSLNSENKLQLHTAAV